LKKDSAVSVLKEMPQEFELDDLIEKLIFIDKIEEGLKQIDEGKKMPLGEVKQIVSEWRK
jgi:predicted transcriptional regulator